MSSRIKQVPFSPEHIKLMDLQPLEQQELDASKADLIDWCLAVYREELAVTLLVDGRILFVMGAAEQLPGNHHIWVIPSVYLPKYSKLAVSRIMIAMKRYAEEMDVTRFQSPVRVDETRERFMMYLGFVKECEMPNYIGNTTYGLWSKCYPVKQTEDSQCQFLEHPQPVPLQAVNQL